MSQTDADRRLERLVAVERDVLGAILIDNAQMDAAQEVLDTKDFFRLGHQQIFEAMVRLSNRGVPIDLTTVRGELTPEQFDEIGSGYYGSLIDGVPRASNVKYYARQVRDASILRSLQAEARQILASAEAAEEPPDAQLEHAEQSLFKLRDRATQVDVLTPSRRTSAAFQQIEMLTASRGALRGAATGLRDLDQDLRGLHPGNLIILGARPSQGKSALALTMAIGAGAATQKPVLFFSLEMSHEELNLRELTMRAQIDGWRLSHGAIREAEQAKLGVALEAMQDGWIHVIDAPGLTVGQIRAMSRRAKATMGVALIIVDYLQLISPDRQRGRRSDTRTIEVGEMSRGLKALAKELRVPVVALSQLSRAVEARSDKRPQMSDLRESGDIEADADVVLLLYRPASYPDLAAKFPANLAELNIAKQRNGPTGPVKLAFLADQTRFADWTDRQAGAA